MEKTDHRLLKKHPDHVQRITQVFDWLSAEAQGEPLDDARAIRVLDTMSKDTANTIVEFSKTAAHIPSLA